MKDKQDELVWTRLQCPACQSHGTVFADKHGYLTCSMDKCPNPDTIKALDQYITDRIIEARVDELKNIVTVMSGIPVSEQGQYLIGDVERRIAELRPMEEGIK